MEKTRVGEKAGGAPQELDAGALLFLFQDLDHGVEVAVALGQGRALRGHVAIVESVKRGTQFFDEFKSDPRAFLRILDRGGSVVPRPQHRPGAEGIGARATESVPVNDGEAQMPGHRLALDQFVGVVVFEGEWIFGLRTFVGDLGNVGKVGGHGIWVRPC